MKSIAIIGGGYTGLTAAYRLSKLGYKVTIFERGDTLGGLAGGFKLEIKGKEYPLEKAYHHLFSTDTDIIELAEELGIGDKLKFYESSMAIYYKHLYPFMSAFDLLKFKPLSFINRIRAGLVVLYLQHQKNYRKFEKITALEWMLKYAGKQVTEVIWKPLLKGKFHNFYDKVSMAWLWARINTRANSREKTGEKLGYFDGGFEIFTNALVKQLKQNRVVIKLNSQISEIRSSFHYEGQVKSDNNSPEIVIDGKGEKFYHILATVPSYVFAKLILRQAQDKKIKQGYLDSLNSINYLGAVLMIFTSKAEISPYYWHNINEENPFLVFLNHTALVGKEMYGGEYVYYAGVYVLNDHKYFEMEDKEISNLWEEKIRSIFKFKGKIENINIFKFKNAQHVVELDYVSKIPTYETPLPGVFLSNFTQIFPQDRGTNYAVREGNKIAQILHQAYK